MQTETNFYDFTTLKAAYNGVKNAIRHAEKVQCSRLACDIKRQYTSSGDIHMLVLKISQHGIRVVFEYTPGNDLVAQMWAPSPHTVEYIGTPFVLLDECFFPEAVKPDMVDRWASIYLENSMSKVRLNKATIQPIEAIATTKPPKKIFGLFNRKTAPLPQVSWGRVAAVATHVPGQAHVVLESGWSGKIHFYVPPGEINPMAGIRVGDIVVFNNELKACYFKSSQEDTLRTRFILKQ